MKTILIIKDADVGLKARRVSRWKQITAARAVLFRGNRIAILHVGRKGYHKLPGGGRELGETLRQALRREILEETGCTCHIGRAIGKVVEFRSHLGLRQESYAYFGHVSLAGKPSFCKDEVADKFRLRWVAPKTAARLISEGMPTAYDGKFIIQRDLRILEEAIRILA